MTLQNETKKQKLTHPVWTHIPAVAMLLVLTGYLIYSSPVPANAPVHFGFDGKPDAWGSPWQFLGIMLGMMVFFIGLSIFLDELWAKQENKKSFNWFSLLDEIVVSWMAGMSLGYLIALNNNAEVFSFPWQYGLAAMGGALVLGVIIELLRPFRPSRRLPEVKEMPEFKKNLVQRLKEDTQFVYWENQNPFYVTLLSTLVPLVFLGAAFTIWLAEGWTVFAGLFGAFFILLAVGMIALTFGGQRVMVTRRELVICWGVGLRVLRLKNTDITGAELMEFSPLKDFGGYGIRFGRGVTAYYLRGRRGVKVSLVNNKKYLLGSDHPERLLAVLELITGSK